MRKYKLVNNTLGWLTFAIAAVVYCLTIEPTASFWDCPEFISTGYKLEVGHPPGAPFFMLTANLFTQFVSDPSQVAKMVNIMSALLSATTILFLFWTITHLVRKLILKDWDSLTPAKLIAIEASGLVGALIYAFSDTFWFSAVEGEVYAYSSAFTAIVFWLILKWEDHADEPHSDRWLVLIMYMTGLSIGVHLLNLLCIPAIVLVFVYRRYPQVELRGSLVALIISFVLIAAVLYGVVPGIITVGGWFELFFVNTLHMPFNTGLVIYILLLVASVIWAIYETYNQRSAKRENIAFMTAFAMLGVPFYGYGWSAFAIGVVVLAIIWLLLSGKINFRKDKAALVSSRLKNTVLLCMLMLMIGYSSYALIVIRSAANPPMDQNSPEDIFTLGNYLSRDQYGDRPLLYGQQFGSEVALDVKGNTCIPKMEKGMPIYQRKEKKTADERDSYFIVSSKDHYVYAQNMLFPRMYSRAREHVAAYEDWLGGIEGNLVPFDRCGEQVTVKMPTMFENLRFFFSYQCNFMYWRYFMWNFVGRQNDIQGNGELEHGNWISGIKPLDNMRLGNQDMLPDELKQNKGHNVYYALPLLLGIIGLFWQAMRGRRGIRQFWVVFFLFFMTGLAIVVYLNQTPLQPRERDYAYAGSFYAFAIWCGLGVAAIIDMAKKYLRMKGTVAAAIIAAVILLVPLQMASQNWDDHDRSGRYTCRDFGQNYLMTLQDEGNPIIFTNGDNDTFPLWYNMDVEGVRTDARVCNLSYLQTDWYIDQMKRPAYDSPSLPITWPRIDYCAGTNEFIRVNPSLESQVKEFYNENKAVAEAQFGKEPFELKNILKYWVRSEDENFHVIPTDTLYMTIDKEAVRKSGMMLPNDSIPDKMVISLEGRSYLGKNDLMMLELISESNWVRPIYVATTVGESNYMNLGDNFIKEGLANRITPFTTKGDAKMNFDVDKVYNNVMNRYKWGGVNTKGVYLDETVRRMCYTHQHLLSQLASALADNGDTVRCRKVLEKNEQVFPEYSIPINYIGGIEFAWTYAKIGDKENAKKYVDAIYNNSKQYIDWYISANDAGFGLAQRGFLENLRIMFEINRVCAVIDQSTSEKRDDEINRYSLIYQQRGGYVSE
ncbi:MAG: DUF2723 domain-containing protein [Prevotella sp.]|nr:DUF2723 domain-containing protein [Prevotella sp.]